MESISQLVQEVRFSTKKSGNRLLSYPKKLRLVGKGRSAYVFKIDSEDKVIKVYFPEFPTLANEESNIYSLLKESSCFPKIFETGSNYIVMEYIKGHTLYECLNIGIRIKPWIIEETEKIVTFARSKGLNPSDIHPRNIILTDNGMVKMIDVVRFKQEYPCHQWDDLKRAFEHFYQKPFFPKKIPALILELIAKLYKKGKLKILLRNKEI